MHLDLVWLIYRVDSENALREANRCEVELKELGIQVAKFKSLSSSITFSQLLNNQEQLPNFVVVLGGDGTVLNAASHFGVHKIPVLSFNVGGNLGFLTHDRILLKSKNVWERIINNDYSIAKRMMLEANTRMAIEEDSDVNINKKLINYPALNDFYFRAYEDDLSPTCTLELEIDGEIVDQYKGDGLIISTPTGSTGYSMNTGGSILHPDLEAIIISPICPISLSCRTLIVPASSKLTIKPIGNKNRKIKLWKDGRSFGLLNQGDSCFIHKASHSANMIILDKSSSYYRTLTEKLHWAGSIKKSQLSSS